MATGEGSAKPLNLHNLGPQSRAMLAGAGIHSEDQLRRLGVVFGRPR